MDLLTFAEDAAPIAETLLGLAFPEALPFIAIAKEAIPAIIAAKPYVEAAIARGESAFGAADKVPGVGAKIRALAAVIPASNVTVMPHLDLVTVIGAGITAPGMTLEETEQWLNNATPHNDPSQENSNVGSG